MSVSIKLARFGNRNNPFFRIVACPTRSKRDGKNLDILGTYDPNTKKVTIDKKKFDVWIKNGAIVTQGVRKLI